VATCDMATCAWKALVVSALAIQRGFTVAYK
jgi:hypothetical protein